MDERTRLDVLISWQIHNWIMEDGIEYKTSKPMFNALRRPWFLGYTFDGRN